MKTRILILCCILSAGSASAYYSQTKISQIKNTIKPPIQHGIKYQLVDDISQYWVSEKLDGMRGYWNGQQLLTRQGNIIHNPKWFTKHWPNYALDGELWFARNQFQATVSCVRKKLPDLNISTSCWHKIKFMIFDLPKSTDTFDERVQQMRLLSQKTQSPYLRTIKQFKLANTEALSQKLNQVISYQGEGLMLHLASAYYQIGRNTALMKLKKHQDAEAKVIAHIQGQGKYQGKLGSLQVKTDEGIVFKIGSGFTNEERDNPPKIDSIITFKYNGKTQAGIPKFARFWRIREKTNAKENK